MDPIDAPPYRWRLALAAGYAAIACHFGLIVARTSWYYVELTDYAAGRTPLPAGGRVLMQPVMRWLMQMLGRLQPATWVSNMPEYLNGVEPLAYLCVNIAAAWLALITFHAISRRIFVRGPFIFASMAAFIAGLYWVFALNPNLPYVQPYDLPAVALMQVCVWLVLQNAWLPLVGVFVLATLNRETSLSIVWLLGARFATGTATDRGARAMCVAMPLLWIATRAGVLHWLAPAGGPVAIWTLLDNAGLLVKPWHWPALLPFLVIPPIALMVARRGPTEARAFALTTLAGGMCLLPFALVTESRAFADLLGFASVTLVFFLQRHWSRA